VSTEIIVSVGRLVVVTGPPGVGKSTVATVLANRARRSVIVDGDVFFAFLTSGAI
jgi:cytidylate kinase